MYSGVLWRFTAKKIVLTHVSKKMQVCTPELWQLVCLIFGREDSEIGKVKNNKKEGI